MAAKTFYLADAADSGWQRLVDGSAQSAATIVGGWVVSTGSTNHSEFEQGAERAASTFTGTGPPDGSLDTGLNDAFRSQNALNGSFASANWEFHFVVRAVTNGGAQDGRVRFRIIKADADGSNATEITAGQQQASAVSNVSTSADFDSTLTVNPGAFSLANQHLFIQVAWERTGAGGMTSSDIDFRTGSSSSEGTRIVTSDFVPTITGDLAATEAADTAALSGDVIVQGTLAPTEAADIAALAGDVIVQGTLAATEGADVFAATGTVGSGTITGDLAATEAADTLAAAGDVIVQGSAAPTEAPDVLAFSGVVVVAGALVVSELADAFAAAGDVIVQGLFATTEARDVLSASSGPTVLTPFLSNTWSRGGFLW